MAATTLGESNPGNPSFDDDVWCFSLEQESSV